MIDEDVVSNPRLRKVAHRMRGLVSKRSDP